MGEVGPNNSEISSKIKTDEIPLTLEGLKEFSSKYLKQRDNKTTKNEELAKAYSERFYGKTEEGENVDIQLSGKETQNTVVVDGIAKNVIARVWVTQKVDEENNAYCYQLTDTGEWILEKTKEKPRTDMEKNTDYWNTKDPSKADKMELSIMKNFLKSAKASSEDKELPKV